MNSFLYFISLRYHVDHVQKIVLPSGLAHSICVHHKKITALYSALAHLFNLKREKKQIGKKLRLF